MAYIPDDPNQVQAQGGQPGQAVTTSTAPGAGPTGAGKGTAANAAPAQPFTNLQSYLSANAPQVGQQAQTIAGDLTSQYGAAKGAVDTAKSGFDSQVAGGYAAPNSDVVDKAASNPTAFVADPNNVAAFKAQYNDKYTGPANFEGTDAYGNAVKKTTDAAQNADLVNTIPGLQTYLSKQTPTATAGDNTLDTVLLQGSPDAYKTVTDAAKPFKTLSDYLAGQTTAADSGVTAAQQMADANAAATQNRFTGTGGVIPTFQSDLDSRLASAQQNSGTQANAAIAALKSITAGTPVDPQLLSELGVTQDQITALANDMGVLGKYAGDVNEATGQPYDNGSYDPTRYTTVQSPDVQINRGNFATADDYAKADALSKLTGQDLSSYLDPANASKAGTANQNTLNFDYGKGKAAADAQVKNDDLGFIQSVIGGFNPDKPDLSQLKSFFDNVTSDQVQANPRIHQAIQAAVRQGLYKAPPPTPVFRAS